MDTSPTSSAFIGSFGAKPLELKGAPNASSSTSEWSRRFAAWTGSHPAAAPLLSDEAISRDSIYGGRGL